MSKTRRATLNLFALAVGTALVAGGGQASAQDKPIVLRGVVPYQTQNYLSQPLYILKKMVEERTGGKIKIDILGSEEVVPALQQFDAVRNGVIDIALGIASYYNNTIPEAIGIQYNKDFLPADLRKNGYHDLMREVHMKKGNVVYLASASGNPGRAFRLYVKKNLDKPDLSGMKIRVSPVYTSIVKGLNGTPVAMPPADVYSALERGVVDGLGWTYAGTLDYGFPEVAKYVIDHPFYSINSTIILSKAAWDKIPQDQRAQLDQIAADFEVAVAKYYEDYCKDEDARLKAKGVSFIKFSPEGVAKFESAAYDAGWAEFLAKNPTDGEKIKKLLTK
ncbi:MAG: TRAP transporter substrate-binding protein DctP [Pseudolabrys sp.]|jgi:TRAP-type C4-dicarboxylate transport system substrate-binding protein|nr:TRAP transporter substrate-binding protein DctP [Pseudolabrys sp.]